MIENFILSRVYNISSVELFADTKGVMRYIDEGLTWAHTNNLIPPHFIEVHVPNTASDPSGIHVC